jgi:hypothetical protein
MSQHDKISVLIKSQLPDFIKQDHEKFTIFLEKYYEYLEQEGKVVHATKTLLDLQNIDVTPDAFAEQLYQTFMRYIPKNIDADKRLLLKHIKDFYRAKGTEKSVRFLLNAMFHADSSFYYPKQDILKVSDGKWYVQKSLRIGGLLVNGEANSAFGALQNFVNTRITGLTSNASALVERADRFFLDGTQVDEIVLSNINGDFSDGEEITAPFDDVEQTSNVSATIFSGLLNVITITDGGEGYEVGDPAIVISSTGTGAVATVSEVTTGNLVSIAVIQQGAGYRINDYVLVSGGGPAAIAANAIVTEVELSGEVHPNSYNLCASTISLEANTFYNAASFINLSGANANVSYANSLSFYLFTNTGPVGIIEVTNPGGNYSETPDMSILANTHILALGILGRMEIVDGGLDYEANDIISFVNVEGCCGTGAIAKVTEVDANGTITSVAFDTMPGFPPGGVGYEMEHLPTTIIDSDNGTGANVAVICVLGHGAELRSDRSTIGSIVRITVSNRGEGYDQNTTIDLTGSGDGNAHAIASVLEGIITYPGRWLNDDGQLSSYNFLQDRDYYQNYSYVVRTTKPLASYRSILKDLTHPAGTKLFGEFLHYKTANNTFDQDAVFRHVDQNIWLKKPYQYLGNTINIAIEANINAEIGVEFISGANTPNLANGVYTVYANGTNYIHVRTTGFGANTSGNCEVFIYSTEDHDH